MPTTTPTEQADLDVAKVIGDALASAPAETFAKPNGVQTVSDKPATPKAKAKPAVKPSRVPVSINGVTVMVDSKLTKANQLTFARSTVAAMTDRQKAKARKGASQISDTDRPAKPAKAKRTPKEKGPLGSFNSKLAAAPTSPRAVNFEKQIVAADADFVAMLAIVNSCTTPAKRARAIAAMFAAMRLLYTPVS